MAFQVFRERTVRRSVWWAAAAIVVGCLAAVAVKGQEPVAAQEKPGLKICSIRTLRGSFGLLASGSRVIPFGPNQGKVETVVGTGLRVYDEKGGFTESAADLHGQLSGVTADPGGIYGTYLVNDDCTGVSTKWVPGLPFPIVSNFVIVNNGKTVKEAVMQPAPNVITVLLDRM
jgi:hypothetical protein